MSDTLPTAPSAAPNYDALEKPIVIYHGEDCFDGFTAAWIAWLKFGDSATYIPARYGDAPPDVLGRDVLIVDFSYPRETILNMHAAARFLRVLDHHKTAQADMDGLPFATFDMERSGAGITWDTLYGDTQLYRPPLVDYVEDRDLWRFRLPDSGEINAYISSWPHTFDRWSTISNALIKAPEACVEEGAAILRCEDQRRDGIVEHARLVRFEGYDVPVVNCTYAYASSVAGMLAETAPFAVAWFQRGDGVYQYSLRSRPLGKICHDAGEGVDVSEIAKRYGGGGHRGAAGFELTTLIF